MVATDPDVEGDRCGRDRGREPPRNDTGEHEDRLGDRDAESNLRPPAPEPTREARAAVVDDDVRHASTVIARGRVAKARRRPETEPSATSRPPARARPRPR